jgi:hypothetical protein
MTVAVTATTDALPVTQRLIVELLAALDRLGEKAWPFPAQARPQLRDLATAGLVWWRDSGLAGTVLAGFTEAGRGKVMSAGYVATVTVEVQWGLQVKGEPVRLCGSREVARLNAGAPHMRGHTTVVHRQITKGDWIADPADQPAPVTARTDRRRKTR